ncbi:MFS transporter [Hwanghaeella sp.]|uniref:MFS transporter n=1 Tax=Hwanghaeella sp. TaxID=2605943 RepID=UPI003CCBE076
MTATVAPIAALLLSVALLLMGNGLQGTLLPVRANIEAFTQIDIGVMGSIYFFGFAIGCYFGPHLVRRVGHIRTFTAMVAIASSVVLGHSMIIESVSWWVMRGMTGFCFAVLYLVIESWLNAKSTNENRGFVFSIYTIINLTVITVGQMLLIADSPRAFTLFALASVLVSLAAVPVALTTAPAPPPVATVKIRLLRLYKLSPVGVMGCLAVGLANGAFWSLAPVFAQELLGGVENIAIFMSVVVIAGAVGQWPLGWLSDKIDRRKVIMTGAAGAALAGAALTILGPASPGFIKPLAFAFGFFALPIYALSVAHMNDFVDVDDYVEAAGGLLLVFAAGAVLGPIFASVVIEQTGIMYLFLYTAVIHVLIGGFALYRMFKRHPAPDEEHVAFADSLRVAQTVANIEELSTATDTHAAHGVSRDEQRHDGKKDGAEPVDGSKPPRPPAADTE